MKQKSKGRHACTFKVRYISEEQARHFSLDGLLRPYQCPHCGQWHNPSEGATGWGRKAKH